MPLVDGHCPFRGHDRSVRDPRPQRRGPADTGSAGRRRPGPGSWRRFRRWQALADAPTADVLRTSGGGLGYNRRAVNLQRAARVIVEEHGGHVPSDLASLEALPGVGPYTARAVAALAFGVPVGAVDTNVRRVLGRITAGDVGVLDCGGPSVRGRASVPPDTRGIWTHALMDIGAMVVQAAQAAVRGVPRPAMVPIRRRSRTPAARTRRPRGADPIHVDLALVAWSDRRAATC